MLVTFRVKDVETKLHSKPAAINAHELVALMRKLHSSNSTILEAQAAAVRATMAYLEKHFAQARD